MAGAGFATFNAPNAPTTLGSTQTSLSSSSSSGSSILGANKAFNTFLPQILQPLPNVTALKSQFDNLFPATSPTQFFDQGQRIVNGLPQVPTIRTPTIAPVQIAFPEGGFDQLRESLFNSQFDPVRREIERREASERLALSGQLAQTGLAESGVGVGQQQQLSREVGEQIGSAASAISESATARALEAQLTVATQQANIDIQRNLAGAQLDLTAQTANARNILERGSLEGNILLGALGLDAAQAENIRGSFLSFLDIKTRAALQQSEIARQSLADIFNALLQKAALDQRSEQLALERPVAIAPQAFQAEPITLPSAFAVGPVGVGPTAGNFAGNITPAQFALASGVTQSPRPSGGSSRTITSAAAKKAGLTNSEVAQFSGLIPTTKTQAGQTSQKIASIF